MLESFFEESLEGLDLMEQELLAMQPGAVPRDVIDAVFRAAHSIKGGGGAFGLQHISDFIHHAETLLDEVRAGRRTMSAELIELLLASVDCTRAMVRAARGGEAFDADQVEAVRRRLQAALEDGATAGHDAATPAPAQAVAGWRIRFVPEPTLIGRGNDPLRLFRELAELGPLTARAELDRLPDFEALDPTELHLSWTLELAAPVEAEEIKEVFAWVLDECRLELEPLPADDGGGRSAGRTETQGAHCPLPPAGGGGGGGTESIRVSLDKIDALINLVGELVITQSMLNAFGGDLSERSLERLRDGLAQLMRNTHQLQETVLKIRMLPIRFCFNRFPRLVHDLSVKLGKQVRLVVSGEDTELDKTVLEHISDPLVHLVRNAMDHGLEMPEERRRAGKPEQGTLALNAYHEGGHIVIEVSDDGRGLDTDKIRRKAVERGLIAPEEVLPPQQINNLVFHPGLSTAETVTDLSGRGVGMDVVKRNINELGGDVWLESEPGRGTTVFIRLPLTLAILDGQLLRVGGEIYIMPLNAIIETLCIDPKAVNTLPGGRRLYRVRDQNIPIVALGEVFGVAPRARRLEDGLLIVVDAERQRYGIWVDELLDQQQVVIKSLKSNFRNVEGISGATILGSGRVALILDIPGIIGLWQARARTPRLGAA